MYIEKTTVKGFRDLIAWQKAKILAVLVYGLFTDSTDFGFKNEIERAAVSVMNNIAEGYERSSGKELVRFLFIAQGSCAEVRSMFDLAKELDYVSQEEFEEAQKLAEETTRLIAAFILTVSGKRSADGEL